MRADAKEKEGIVEAGPWEGGEETER